jgi:hypothetical protein
LPGNGAPKQDVRVKAETQRTSDEQSGFLKLILDQDRPDAFDPNAFNRKVHGGAGAR